MPHVGLQAPDQVRDFGEEFEEVTSTSVAGNKRALDSYVRNPTSDPVSTQEFYFEVAKGNVPGHLAVFVSGENNVLDNTFQTMWPIGGNYTRRFTASNLNISSASVDDTLAGTGAQKVVITGVTAGYVEATEEIDLDGQTAVPTVNDYIAINNILVTQVGSGGFNAGRIYASTGSLSSGVPAVAGTYNVIEATDSLSRGGVYTVPAGFTAYISGVATSTDANKDAIVQLKFINSAQVEIKGFPIHITNQSITEDILLMASVPEKTIIEPQAKDVDAALSTITISYLRVANDLVGSSALRVF